MVYPGGLLANLARFASALWGIYDGTNTRVVSGSDLSMAAPWSGRGGLMPEGTSKRFGL